MEAAGQFSAAGCMVANGRGSRVRGEKALLKLEDTMLVERIAQRIRRAAGNMARNVACDIPDGIQAMCFYHPRTLLAAGRVIDHKYLTMKDFPKCSRAVSRRVADSVILQNDNTPAQNAGVPGGWTAR